MGVHQVVPKVELPFLQVARQSTVCPRYMSAGTLEPVAPKVGDLSFRGPLSFAPEAHRGNHSNDEDLATVVVLGVQSPEVPMPLRHVEEPGFHHRPLLRAFGQLVVKSQPPS